MACAAFPVPQAVRFQPPAGALWLCFAYAPARFDTHLAVIIRQFPDVGVSLVPVLGLALLWSVPRTVWLFARLRRTGTTGRS